MDNPSRILVADDHSLFRAGLCAILACHPEFEVIAEAGNGQEAIRLASEQQPELVLLDISMPITNGTEALALIRRRSPQSRVLMLTAHNTDEFIRESLRLGASGYLLKTDSSQELIQAMHSILQGHIYLSPAVCSNVVAGYLGHNPAQNHSSTGWEALTQRERETLKLVAEGYRNREIADHLNLSPKTIEKHRANLMAKLELRSVSALTTYAIENGLVTG